MSTGTDYVRTRTKCITVGDIEGLFVKTPRNYTQFHGGSAKPRFDPTELARTKSPGMKQKAQIIMDTNKGC